MVFEKKGKRTGAYYYVGKRLFFPSGGGVDYRIKVREISKNVL